MAREYDDNNKGAVYINDRKEQPNHPDRKGKALIDGVEYWVSGWIKEVKNGANAGQKFLSLSFTRKDGQPPSRQVNAPAGDDIPF